MKSNANTKLRKRRGPGVLASGVIEIKNADTGPGILSEDILKEPLESFLIDGKKWIRFFDNDSTFLSGLIALLNNSHTLRSIIINKSWLCVGDGFLVHEGKPNTILKALRRLWKRITGEDQRLQDLNDDLSTVNALNESMEDVAYKCFFDYFGFGNVFVELVRGTTNENGKEEKYLYAYHVPLVRTAIEKPEPGQLVQNIGIHEDWSKKVDFTRDDDVTLVPIYPTWSDPDDDGDEYTIIHIKNYAPGFLFWGICDWISARFYAELEYRIPKYNISKFKNGFTPSAIVQFFGSTSKEGAKEIISKFQSKFTDTGNNAKIFAQVLRSENLKANVQVLKDESEGNYLELSKIAAQALVSANRWTMSLAGFAQSGKLGTNQQIRQEFEVVKSTVIRPARKVMLQSFINVYLQESVKHKERSYEKLHLSFSDVSMVSLIDNISPEFALSLDERRDVLGFEAATEDQRTEIATYTSSRSNRNQG